MPRLVDTFLFMNELDLLEIRLNELSDYVDRFVICESAETHSGKRRDLVFPHHKEKYKKFLERITYLAIEAFPAHLTPLQKENYHRNALVSEQAKLQAGDYVLFSDLDEIPDLSNLKLSHITEPRVFLLKSAYYYLNNLIEEPLNHKFTRCNIIVQYDGKLIPQTFRDQRSRLTPAGSGWHFSFQGGAEIIQKKIEAFLHQEYNTNQFKSLEEIHKRLAENRDPFDRNFLFKPIPIDETFPRYLRENQDRYKHLIKEI